VPNSLIPYLNLPTMPESHSVLSVIVLRGSIFSWFKNICNLSKFNGFNGFFRPLKYENMRVCWTCIL